MMKSVLGILTSIYLFLIIPGSIFAADFNVEYFNNTSLSGSPVLSRTEAEINYNWVSGSPDSLVPNDNFSARWVKTDTFESGTYIFTATADDGIRVFLDDVLILNEWKDQGPTTYAKAVDVTAGNHIVKVEYYERTGGATAVVKWEKEAEETTTGKKIMPLGDSITDGWDIPGGYRIELKNLLVDSNFVGSLQNGPAGLTDREHEGHSGWRIHELQAQIVSWLESQNPEMILLMIGTNDMIGNYEVATAPQRLSALIDSISQTKPNADILVASIPPLANTEWNNRVNSYNAAIPGIVQQKKDAGKKVHYVDMNTALTAGDLPDGIHPNTAGYVKIAQKWKTAIDIVNSGSTPEIPEVPGEEEPVGEGPFTARYFNNLTLSGTPVLTRNEVKVNNDWVAGSPHSSVGINNFSADWTTTQTFVPGVYEFSVTGDDGVRLYVNNELLINEWKDQGPTTYKATKELDGEVTVKMEYYEKTGGAVAKLNWIKIGEIPEEPVEEEPTDPSEPVGVPTDGGFKAEYFNNMTLSGTPVLTRIEDEVNYNWVGSSPHSLVNTDNFSARWQGNYTFQPGIYRFTVRGDDGIKLIVGGKTYINYWKDQGPTTYTSEIPLDGEFPVVLEYYEKTGGAVAELQWEMLSSTPSEEPGEEEPEVVVPSGSYLSEYFNNTNLSGSPVATFPVDTVDYDWGLNAPYPGVNTDNFSTRWTLVENFEAKMYKFTVTADDGVRLKIDGNTVIDKWIDQGATTYSVDVPLTAGEHTIVMEYYEKGWGAVAKLAIEQIVVTPPPEVSAGSFLVSYFNNINLTGSPIHSEEKTTLQNDWGLNAPHVNVNKDNFSVKATKTDHYSAGNYRFTVRADDGVRLKVDGVTVINKWIDQAATTYTYDLALTAGSHAIEVEYYEKEWGAVLEYSESAL